MRGSRESVDRKWEIHLILSEAARRRSRRIGSETGCWQFLHTPSALGGPQGGEAAGEVGDEVGGLLEADMEADDGAGEAAGARGPRDEAGRRQGEALIAAPGGADSEERQRLDHGMGRGDAELGAEDDAEEAA